jgi:hypothetical protein
MVHFWHLICTTDRAILLLEEEFTLTKVVIYHDFALNGAD